MDEEATCSENSQQEVKMEIRDIKVEEPEHSNEPTSSRSYLENMIEGTSNDYQVKIEEDADSGGLLGLLNKQFENSTENDAPAEPIVSTEEFLLMLQTNLEEAIRSYDAYACTCSESEEMAEDILKEFSRIIADYVRTCDHFEQLRIVNLISQGCDLGFIYFMRNFNSIDDTLCSVERTFGDWKMKLREPSVASVEYLKGYGLNLYGNLGIEDQDVHEPVLINIPPVKQVSMSNSHTVFLTKNNELFGCGTQSFFHPHSTVECIMYEYIKFELPNKQSLERIVDVYAGETFTVVLTLRYIYWMGKSPFLNRKHKKEQLTENCYRIPHSMTVPNGIISSENCLKIISINNRTSTFLGIKAIATSIPIYSSIIKTTVKRGEDNFPVGICHFVNGLYWSPDDFEKWYAKVCVIVDGKVLKDELKNCRNIFSTPSGIIYIHMAHGRVLKGPLCFLKANSDIEFASKSEENEYGPNDCVLVAYVQEIRGMSNVSVFAMSPDGENCIAQSLLKNAESVPLPEVMKMENTDMTSNCVYVRVMQTLLPRNANIPISSVLWHLEQLGMDALKYASMNGALGDDSFDVNGRYHPLKILLLSLNSKVPDGLPLIFTNELDSEFYKKDPRSIAFNRLKEIEKRYGTTKLRYPEHLDERYKEDLWLRRTSYHTSYKSFRQEWARMFGSFPPNEITPAILKNGRLLVWMVNQISLLLDEFLKVLTGMKNAIYEEVLKVIAALIQIAHQNITRTPNTNDESIFQNSELGRFRRLLYPFSVVPTFKTSNIETIVMERVRIGNLPPESVPLDIEIFFDRICSRPQDSCKIVVMKTNSDLLRITNPKLYATAVNGKIDVLKISRSTKNLMNEYLIVFHYLFYNDNYYTETPRGCFDEIRESMAKVGIELNVLGSNSAAVFCSTRTATENIQLVPDNTPREDVWVLETNDGGCMQCHRVLLSAYSERLHEMGSRMEKNENGEVVIKLDTDQPTLQHSLFALCDIKYLLDLPFEQTIHVFQFFHDNMMCEAACDALDVLVHNANEFNCHLLHPLFEKHAELLFERLKKRPSLLINHRTCPFPQPALKYYKRFTKEYPRVNVGRDNDAMLEGRIPFREMEILRRIKL